VRVSWHGGGGGGDGDGVCGAGVGGGECVAGLCCAGDGGAVVAGGVAAFPLVGVGRGRVAGPGAGGGGQCLPYLRLSAHRWKRGSSEGRRGGGEDRGRG